MVFVGVSLSLIYDTGRIVWRSFSLLDSSDFCEFKTIWPFCFGAFEPWKVDTPYIRIYIYMYPYFKDASAYKTCILYTDVYMFFQRDTDRLFPSFQHFLSGCHYHPFKKGGPYVGSLLAGHTPKQLFASFQLSEMYQCVWFVFFSLILSWWFTSYINPGGILPAMLRSWFQEELAPTSLPLEATIEKG